MSDSNQVPTARTMPATETETETETGTATETAKSIEQLSNTSETEGTMSAKRDFELTSVSDADQLEEKQPKSRSLLPTPTVTENLSHTPTPAPTKTGPHAPVPGAVPSPIITESEEPITLRVIPPPSPVPGRVPFQPNSTQLPTGPRNKTPLPPGFSSLDWDNKMKEIHNNLRERANELVKPGLILLTKNEEEIAIFAKLSEHNIPLLQRALKEDIPCYMLRPRLKFNADLVRRHQVDEGQYWCVIHKKVYCISPYLKFHPGGKDAILDECKKQRGKRVDIGFSFDMQHRWVNYKQILEECYIGDYVREVKK